MTKSEQRKLAITLARAKDLITDTAEKDHSPFRRARARGEIVNIDQAIQLIQESVQRATVQGRRPFRGSTRRSVRS